MLLADLFRSQGSDTTVYNNGVERSQAFGAEEAVGQMELRALPDYVPPQDPHTHRWENGRDGYSDHEASQRAKEEKERKARWAKENENSSRKRPELWNKYNFSLKEDEDEDAITEGQNGRDDDDESPLKAKSAGRQGFECR